MTTMQRILLMFALAPAAGCAAVFGGSPDITYRVRAIPGPVAFEKNYTFERGDLIMNASATREREQIIFHIEFRNSGSDKLKIRAGELRLRERGGDTTYPVVVEDGGKERDEIWLMSHEARNLMIRPSDRTVVLAAPAVLEFRGARDSYGRGNYEFDMFVEEVPIEADRNARGPIRPEEQQDDIRRPLHESTREEQGVIKKTDKK